MIKEKVIFDTNIYIDIINNKDSISKYIDYHNETIYLSSVVIMELLAGCSTEKIKKELTKYFRNFDKRKRIITPSKNAFFDSGNILNLLVKNEFFDKAGLNKITNDILIAISCLENGIKLKTKNIIDFERISKYRDGLKIEYFK